MIFDFDTVPNRHGTDSRKWRKYAGRDILPLWIADMDFAAPPAIVAALHRRVDQGVFGYGTALPSLSQSVVDHCAARYNWRIDPAWIVWLPGLVTGLNVAAEAIGQKGDAVITATPVYPPFMCAPQHRGRELIAVPLALQADGRHAFDWTAMERAVTPRTKMFFLCSPHNPVGRAYTRPELEQVAAFCDRHDLVLVSDDIHCDLILDPLAHIPVASLSPAAARRTITLLAPSKTYNMPGLTCSLAVIPAAALRQQFVGAMTGIVPEMNVLGYVAGEAAYRDCEPWRQALLTYLRGNRDYLAAFLKEHLPAIRMTPCEATYLAWLDVSALKLADPIAHFEAHGVGLSDGVFFGAPRGSHVRLNFGCPRATLAAALQRMKRAVAATP